MLAEETITGFPSAAAFRPDTEEGPTPELNGWFKTDPGDTMVYADGLGSHPPADRLPARHRSSREEGTISP